MIKTIKEIYEDWRILLDSDNEIPDKTTVYISYKDDTNEEFFLNSSEYSLDKIWANEEDDVYEQLLKK
ncbi:MAG: hypothetical protein RO257_09970 [Candidatus Kapabacteria bacterium]|nr:hypothetical protein [Candidatus Kapabacteria bacterium]